MQARQLKAVSRQTGLLCSPLKAFFYCGAELPGHSSTVELSQGAKTKMTLVLNSVLTVLSPAQAQVARGKTKMMGVWKTLKKSQKLQISFCHHCSLVLPRKWNGYRRIPNQTKPARTSWNQPQLNFGPNPTSKAVNHCLPIRRSQPGS